MSTLPPAGTLRERLGGRWALSSTTYVAIVIATAVTVAFDGLNSPGVLLGIAAVGGLAACTVLLAADLTILRNRREHPVAPAVVVGVGMAAGLARGVVVIAMTGVLGTDIARGTAAVIVGSMILGTVTVVGAALILDSLSRQREERAQLVARLAALRELAGERTELVDAIGDAAYAEMLSALDEARRGIREPVGAMSVEDRLAVAEGLRRTVNEQVRPISHRLHAASRRPTAVEANRWRVLALGLRRLVPYPLASALVLMGVASVYAEYALGPFIVGGLVWLALTSVVALGRRYPWVRRQQMPAGLALAAATSAAAIGLLRWLEGESEIAGVAIATVLIVVWLTVFTSLVAMIIGSDSANTRLAEEVDARELEAMVVNREMARASRDLAQFVHGTVQSALLATAFSIERAARDCDEAAFARALADAREALSQDPAVVRDACALPEALDRVAGLWRGFVEVHVNALSDDVSGMPTAVVADVERIVGEALANARKHGGARSVLVDVRHDDGDQWVISVTDDGVGPLGGVAGMGSAWLDFVAPDAWSLQQGPDGAGATLEVRLFTSGVRTPGVAR